MHAPPARMDNGPPTSSMFGPPYGGPPNYGTAHHLEEGYNRKVPENITSARYSIAYLSTVAQLTVYSGPVILGVQLGMDPDAVYWVGRIGISCLLVPLIILLLHALHLFMLWSGRPAKMIFLLMAILPGAVIAYTGGVYSSASGNLYGLLVSEDCTKGRGDGRIAGWQKEKHDLQAAYETAKEILTDCRALEHEIEEKEYHLQDMANQREKITKEPTLLNCQAWAVHGQMHDEIKGWTAWAEKTLAYEKKYKAEFTYLAAVEANMFCGGFCEPGPMLWMDYDLAGGRAEGKRHAACAPLVAAKFGIILREGRMCFYIGVVGVFFLVFAFNLMKPLLEYLGYRTNPWTRRD